MSDLDDTIREIVRDEIKKALADGNANGAPPGQYLSMRAAGELASVSTRTIWNWIHSGKLAAHGTGRLVRVLHTELEALLREGKKRRPEASPEASPEELAKRYFAEHKRRARR